MSNALSFVCGASTKPLLYKTIGNALKETAGAFPEREALVVCHQGVRWTYAELNRRVDEFAAGLIALGFVPGDRVGMNTKKVTSKLIEYCRTLPL